jgi:hypothetical protein
MKARTTVMPNEFGWRRMEAFWQGSPVAACPCLRLVAGEVDSSVRQGGPEFPDREKKFPLL